MRKHLCAVILLAAAMQQSAFGQGADRFEVSSTTASWLPSRAGVSAIKVYDRMTALGFERLAEGLRQRLFDPSSSAYDEMFKVLDAESR